MGHTVTCTCGHAQGVACAHIPQHNPYRHNAGANVLQACMLPVVGKPQVWRVRVIPRRVGHPVFAPTPSDYKKLACPEIRRLEA